MDDFRIFYLGLRGWKFLQFIKIMVWFVMDNKKMSIFFLRFSGFYKQRKIDNVKYLLQGVISFLYIVIVFIVYGIFRFIFLVDFFVSFEKQVGQELEKGGN